MKLREVIVWCSCYFFQTNESGNVLVFSFSCFTGLFWTLYVFQVRMLRRMRLKKTLLLLIFRMFKMPFI